MLRFRYIYGKRAVHLAEQYGSHSQNLTTSPALLDDLKPPPTPRQSYHPTTRMPGTPSHGVNVGKISLSKTDTKTTSITNDNLVQFSAVNSQCRSVV